MFRFKELNLSQNARQYLSNKHIVYLEQLMVSFTPKKDVLKKQTYYSYKNEILILSYALHNDDVVVLKNEFEPIYNYIRYLVFISMDGVDEIEINIKIKEQINCTIPKIVRAAILDIMDKKMVYYKNNLFIHDLSRIDEIYYLPFMQMVIKQIKKGEKPYSKNNAELYLHKKGLKKYVNNLKEELLKVKRLYSYSIFIKRIIVKSEDTGKFKRISGEDFTKIFPYENEAVYYLAKLVPIAKEDALWNKLSLQSFLKKYRDNLPLLMRKSIELYIKKTA